MDKLLLSLFLLLTVFSAPAFADGGVPLWGLNTSVFFTISTMGTITAFSYPDAWGTALFFLIFTLIILLLVVFVETLVVNRFINNLDFNKLFVICFKANLISTLVGIILLFLPVPFVLDKLNTMEGELFGPWGMISGAYSLFLYNFLCLPISYIIEYTYAKRVLQQDCDIPTIKKSFLFANIATYVLPILIYGIACVIQFKNSIH